jgi:hypothetical protein
MSDRTGYKHGTLEPIIYFERSDSYAILPVYDAGCPEQARRVFNERYKNHATERWQWRETDGTLSAVDALQKRLVDQEERRDGAMIEAHAMVRERWRKQVSDSLRARMCSSATSPFEREFIEIYLTLREEKTRDKYRQQLEHRNHYLWLRENNSTTKVEDKAIMLPGEFWRNEQQQRD